MEDAVGRTTGLPKLLRAGEIVRPAPVPLTERFVDEGWLQDQIDQHPELLPIEEIGSAWGPLISLGREIQTPSGPIDNLFVSPNGELTVVETKLWRNPEARRKVIGQVLDYASCLAQMSYEELDEAVSVASAGDVSIWGAVRATAGLAVEDEANFHDVVNRNLAAGRFLLLIVGDGIREDVEGMADLLSGQPNAAFHLELVELRLFRLDADDLLLVPSLVARTVELERFTVRLIGDGVTLEKQSTAEEGSASPRARPLASIDAFVEVASVENGSEWAEAAADFIRGWEARGGKLRRNSQSINLGLPFRHNSSGSISVATVYVDGEVELSVTSFARWQECIPFEEASALALKYGFTGHRRDWPRRPTNFADEGDRTELVELIDLIVEVINAEERRLDHAAAV